MRRPHSNVGVVPRTSQPGGSARRAAGTARAIVPSRTANQSRRPRGIEAICTYRVVERFEATSPVEVRLTTGKRNQIRIQARLRGHTLVGERRYTYGPDDLRPIEFGRQALHACRLSFVHPVGARPMTFEAPLPPDMASLIEALRPGGAPARPSPRHPRSCGSRAGTAASSSTRSDR